MVSRRSFWISCLVAIFGLANLAAAQGFRHSNRLVSITSHPTVTQGTCGPTDITESGSDTVVALNSVSCNNGVAQFDNHYWRAFLLSDFGITGNLDVCDVEIGVEEATAGAGQGGTQPITVNLYTSDQAFPTGFPGSLTPIGTLDTTVADQTGTLVHFPVTGTAPAGSQLVVEIFAPNSVGVGNLFFIGSNADPETNPSYLSAADCGVPNPTPTADIPPGFPDMHIVMHVFGTEVAVVTVDPTGLSVDTPLAAGILNNGVLEMNETPVLVAPQWKNTNAVAITMTGAVSNFTGPGDGDPTNPVVYTIDDPTADYGTIPAGAMQFCTDCYGVDIAGDRTTVPTHSDATIQEDVNPIEPPAFGQPSLVTKNWTLHIGESFGDVSNDTSTNPFYPKIETILHNGVTGGCAAGPPALFCPGNNVLRQEMAPFLLKGFLGGDYAPPDCTGIFQDVPCPATPDFPYSNFIEDLSTRGITGGCATGPPALYCPGDPVTRAQMAPFLLKTLLGGTYAPPDCTGLFTDVPCPVTPEFPYSNFIEDLSTRGITAGCQVGPPALYCPDSPVTREQMAAFLTLTFSLVLYGP
jgi:hypothetical protein